MAPRRFTEVSPTNAHASDARLTNMRSFAVARKKVSSRIKSFRVFRIFRTRTASNIPFSDRDIRYVVIDHQESGTGTPDSAANDRLVEPQCEISVTPNVVAGAPARDGQEEWKAPSEEADRTQMNSMSVSDREDRDDRYDVTPVNEADVLYTQPPSDVTNIKGLRRVSKDHQSAPLREPPAGRNPADWSQKRDGEISCETFYTAISEASFAIKWAAGEPMDVYDEIDPKRAENHGASPESDEAQKQSLDLPTSARLLKISSRDSEVHNDISSVLDSTVTGNGADISCETVDRNDDVDPIQSLKENTPLAPGRIGEISKTVIDNNDREKAERIERRRKLLAKKKEARLRRAMEYDAREAAKVGSTCSNESEPKPSIEVPIVDDGADTRAAASEESKIEEDIASVSECISEHVEWSKEEARKAKEQRKRGQKERLLNLLSGCIIVHKGDVFEESELSK